MRIKVENPVNDFGMVPRALWRMMLPNGAPLPFAAKALGAYLFCLRDGAMPYVGEIEATLGIGRDARRKAFAALEAAKVIEWHVEHCGRRIVGKTLKLHPLAVVAAGEARPENSNAPENQAHGEMSNAPENPTRCESVPERVENRSCGDGGSGDTEKEKKKERARRARERAALPSERQAAPRRKVARTTSSAAPAQSGQGAGESKWAAATVALPGVPSRLVAKRAQFQAPDGSWYERPRDPEEAQRFNAWFLNAHGAPVSGAA